MLAPAASDLSIGHRLMSAREEDDDDEDDDEVDYDCDDEGGDEDGYDEDDDCEGAGGGGTTGEDRRAGDRGCCGGRHRAATVAVAARGHVVSVDSVQVYQGVEQAYPVRKKDGGQGRTVSAPCWRCQGQADIILGNGISKKGEVYHNYKFIRQRELWTATKGWKWNEEKTGIIIWCIIS